MKLSFDVQGRAQPDPFVFEDGNRLYLYVTAVQGVEAYSADDLLGAWKYEGTVAHVEGALHYWAPAVIRHGDRYYMYVSFTRGADFEFLHALSSDSPLGPFEDPVCLYHRFSIDPHAVRTESGLYLFYAEDRREGSVSARGSSSTSCLTR